MEDRTKVADLTQHAAFSHCQRAGFFAVFDGHAGEQVAEHLSSYLLSYFLEDPTNALDPLDALRSAVLHCEADVLERGMVAGSTALVAVLMDSDLYVANVGDSRAVLSRRSQPKPDQLTTDHKPLESGERQRLEQAGANISCDGYICGEIAVARALGSPHLKKNPRYRDFVICEPELKHVHLAEDDDFLILATDGLWDAMTNEQVVNRAKNQLGSCRDPLVCAEHLVDTSVRMKQNTGTADNVSVVVVLLHDRPFTLRKGNSMLFKNLKREELRADSVSTCSSAFNSPRLPVIEQQPGSSPEPGAAPSSGLAKPAEDAAAAPPLQQLAQGNGVQADVNGMH
jgi:protein phosphatase 1L